MRLALIHGINNERNTPKAIEDSWWKALADSWKDLGFPVRHKPAVSVAYYADILGKSKPITSQAVAMGAPDSISSGYAIDFLKAYADAAGVTEDELKAVAQRENVPPEAVEQGIPHDGWVIAFAGLLEKILPDKGLCVADLFLRQAALGAAPFRWTHGCLRSNLLSSDSSILHRSAV
jgi:hypothetical protein